MNHLRARNVAGFIFVIPLLACFGGSGGGGHNDSASKFVYMVEGGTSLIRFDLTLSERTPILTVGSPIKQVRVSPDGKSLMYVQNGVLTTLLLSTTTTRTFPGYKAGDWSGDGSKIFAVSDGDNIFSMNLDGTGASPSLASGTAIDSIDIDESGTKMAVAWSNSGWPQIVHLTTGGTLVTTLTATGVASDQPRWARDGNAVFYDRDNTIWRNGPTGTAATEEALLGGLSFPSCPSVGKSGSIFFVRTGDLYEANADGTGMTSRYHSPFGSLSWPDSDVSGP